MLRLRSSLFIVLALTAATAQPPPAQLPAPNADYMRHGVPVSTTEITVASGMAALAMCSTWLTPLLAEQGPCAAYAGASKNNYNCGIRIAKRTANRSGNKHHVIKVIISNAVHGVKQLENSWMNLLPLTVRDHQVKSSYENEVVAAGFCLYIVFTVGRLKKEKKVRKRRRSSPNSTKGKKRTGVALENIIAANKRRRRSG